MPKNDYTVKVIKPFAKLFAIEAAVILAWLGIVAIFMRAGLGEYLAVVVLMLIAFLLTIGSDLLTAFIKVSGLSSHQTPQPDHSRPAEAGSERMGARSSKEPALPRLNSEH